MARGFRVWIEVEEFDPDREDEREGGGESVRLDIPPTATFIATRDDEVSTSRARDRAVGFAERLHELAALERAS